MTNAAKILGRQRSHVSRAITTPEFKQYWSDLQADLFRSVDQRLRHLLLVAAETHLQLLKSEDNDVRLRAVALVYSGPHAAYLSTLRSMRRTRFTTA